MPILGQTETTVRYRGSEKKLPLYVVANGLTLLGRNWLEQIKLYWKTIGQVNAKPPTRALLEKHPCLRNTEIFTEELGTIDPFTAKLRVRSNVAPKFCKARLVLIKGAIECKLEHLESCGILDKVDYSEWAAPIVAIPKKDSKFRICGDYKVTVNQALDVEQYHQRTCLRRWPAEKFTKLDLSQAYQQLPFDEGSRKYVTVNTHKGLYQYTRLLFGIATAPAMLQKIMDTILQGIPNVVCYINDILVTGKYD